MGQYFSQFSPLSFLLIMSPLLACCQQLGRNVGSLIRHQKSMKLQGAQKVARIMNGSTRKSDSVLVSNLVMDK